MLGIKRLISGLLIAAMMAVSAMAITVAQDGQGGSGLQITPTRTEMSLLPGEQKDFEITVKNVTQGKVDVKSFFNDFESDGVTGEPKIVVDPNREVANSMKDYVKGLSDFSLEKDESKTLKYTVDLPADASPGGYYGVVRYAAYPSGTKTDDDGTQVSLNASVASLLLVEASGDITEQIQLDSVNSCYMTDKEINTSGSKCDKSSALFIGNPANMASIAVSNKGNSFSRPFGRVTVSRGGTEVYAYELNNKEPRGIILPGSTRVFSDKIENTNKIGKYTITANISYGQGGEVITKSVSFWYFPVWALIVLGVVLIALVAGAFVVFKKLGKKRK